MAYWLGNNDIQEEDLSNFIRSRKNLLKFYTESMKFRIVPILNQEECKEFEKAVKKIYGSFSAFNSRQAALDAIKKWSQEKK